MASFNSVRPLVGGVLAASTLLIALSCGSDKENDARPGTNDAGDGGGGGASSGFQSSGSLPDAPPGEPCVAKEAEAIQGKRPVDIIFVIDNSESMAEEIGEVEKQINQNFASIIEQSNSDYRVIMLSLHGTHDNPDAGTLDGGSALQRVCVKSPLSGTNCDPVPAKPVETSKFIHYSTVINSTDAWCKILSTFNAADDPDGGAHPLGWSAFLRKDAFKVFAIITDDRVETTCGGVTYDDKTDDPVSGANAAASFEAALFTLSPQFGNSLRRNYVWHSIVGLAPYDSSDLTKPYPPDAPITAAKCSPTTAVAPATGYQGLSKLTGGLRFPTCGLDFTTIFQAMAQDVIGKSVLACDYALPKPDTGTIDPGTAVVRYTSGTNVVTNFDQVANEQACAANKFFIEGERIKLCPDSCLTVQNDPSAQVKILFGCLPNQAK